MASDKRCHYEILGLNRDCSPEEIRSAYRKLALQRHPDKLIQTGVSEEQATAAFQELVNAYEVLSDPRERAWYDSHRSQILFSDSKSSKSSGPVPDLFSFFSNTVYSGFGDTGKGFYKVYGDVFGKIYAQEVAFAKKLGLGEESVRVAPLMGNLESPYTQVTAFYNYWSSFITVMDFCWADEYDVMAGPNRKSRRLMEEENKKVRKRERREYNDTVRGLAGFAKKRDKRVVDMQMKKAAEEEKKREEEKKKKKEAARAKFERARMYEEPEWAKIEEEIVEEEEEEDDGRKNGAKELYCVVCSKKFKSDKQWKNHEQSKKHREKVAELGDTYGVEEEDEEVEEFGDDGNEDDDFGPSTSTDNIVDELSEQFENDFGFHEKKSGFTSRSTDEEENEVSNADNDDEVSESFETSEESHSHKTMTSGRKGRKKSIKRQPEPYLNEPHLSAEGEDMDLMQNNSRRNARRNRAAKKEGVQKVNEDAGRVEGGVDTGEAFSNSNGSDAQGIEGSIDAQDTMSQAPENVDLDSQSDPPVDKNQKITNQRIKKKDTGKGDANNSTKNNGKGDIDTRVSNSSKRKKQRGQSKNIDHSCTTCGEEFVSRNKLHKHLSDTGHAALKSR